MTIGQLAAQAGVGVETVRYYERRGLLPEPPRKPGAAHHAGYRQYDAGALARLRFIRNAQELGFTLAEIRELLELRVAEGTTCRDVKARAETKLADVERKIAELDQLRRALSSVAARCGGGELPAEECPILEELKDWEESA